MPEGYDELIELPGIGPYTAAAVSSIAFDRDHPVLDGNVTRVLCRLLNIDDDPRRAAVKTDLIAAGERLLARGKAGEFNQAMMELGSSICKPRAPLCEACPVAEMCVARLELDDPSVLPVKAQKSARPHYEVTAGLIWKGDMLLVAQRRPDGMLGGMWEFPGGKRESGETLAECLRREIGGRTGSPDRSGRATGQRRARLLALQHHAECLRGALPGWSAAGGRVPGLEMDLTRRTRRVADAAGGQARPRRAGGAKRHITADAA